MKDRSTTARSTRCHGDLKYSHRLRARYSFEKYSSTKKSITVTSQISKKLRADDEKLMKSGRRMIGSRTTERNAMNLSESIESTVSLASFLGSTCGTKIERGSESAPESSVLLGVEPASDMLLDPALE